MDPLTGAAVAGGVSNFVSGIMGNRSRRREAAKNRQFQERMRNTEWQAAVRDMEAAGINPALAYSQGGASSPSGSMANQENVGEDSVSSAFAIKQQAKSLEMVDAQIANVKADTYKKGTEQQEIQSQFTEQNRRNSFYQNMLDGSKLSQRFIDLMEAELDTARGGARYALSQARSSRFDEEEKKAMAEAWANMGPGAAGLKTFLAVITSIIGRS